MTISSENYRKQYSGNGSTTVFPYDFKITAASQLNVIVTSSTGIETTKVLDTDYSVSGVGIDGGGNVTYPISGTVLPTGSLITIRRVVSLTQLTDLINQTAFQAQTLEESLDYQTMIAQQLQEESNRSIKTAPSDSSSVILPATEQRKNSALGFDSNGNPIMIPASNSLASFRQHGSTVDRTVTEKLYESVSVKDFGAVGDGVANDVISFQAAIDAVNFCGGGRICVPYGIYKLDSGLVLYSNIALDIDKNAVLDFTDSETNSQLLAVGSVGTEINLATSVTSGDTVIQTATAHGLSIGDWVLLKSQRVCLHDDAGIWRLGETTSGTISPYFGEPLQVELVDSPTQITCRSKIIFPDYNTDKLSETSPDARACSTIKKISFVTNLSISGGNFINSQNENTLIRLQYCYKPKIDIGNIDLGMKSGVGVYLYSCLGANVKASASRPAQWVLLSGEDHSAFNSFKDVSSWYCSWDVEDLNGSQGWDQTFSSGHVCSINPNLKMKSINSREDGSITHGGCYGADIDIEAYGAQSNGFVNRVRFSKIKIRVIGETSGASGGLVLSGWGMLDTIVHDSYFQNTPYGIDCDAVGAVDIAPPEKNLIITNIIFIGISSGSTIWLRDLDDVSTIPSGVRISNIKIKDCLRGIYIGEYWHDVSIDHVDINRLDTSIARKGIEYRPNAAGGKVSNIIGYNIGAGNTLIYLGGLTNSSIKAIFPVTCWVDEASCYLYGTGTLLVGGNNIGYAASSGYYTPTLTGVTNSTPGTAAILTYSIIKNVVTISGTVTVATDGSGVSETRISLPHTGQTFSASYQASGVAHTYNKSGVLTGVIFPDTTNEELTFQFYATAASNQSFKFICQYQKVT